MDKDKKAKRPLVRWVLILGLVAVAIWGTSFLAHWGVVTSTIDRPNRAEDGYRGITVLAANGRTYTIDATGLLNQAFPTTPPTVCLPTPKAHTGDVVIFGLPTSTYQIGSYTTCRQQSMEGYYLKVIPFEVIAVSLAAVVLGGWYLRRKSKARN